MDKLILTFDSKKNNNVAYYLHINAEYADKIVVEKVVNGSVVASADVTRTTNFHNLISDCSILTGYRSNEDNYKFHRI